MKCRIFLLAACSFCCVRGLMFELLGTLAAYSNVEVVYYTTDCDIQTRMKLPRLSLALRVLTKGGKYSQCKDHHTVISSKDNISWHSGLQVAAVISPSAATDPAFLQWQWHSRIPRPALLVIPKNHTFPSCYPRNEYIEGEIDGWLFRIAPKLIRYGSQYGEDYLLLFILGALGVNPFSKNRTARSFGYIEMGAHDGELLSTTLLFQRAFQWRGLLVEPGGNFQALKKNRPEDILENVPVCSKPRKIDFVDGGVFGGMANTMEQKHVEMWKERFGKSKQIACVRLESLLDKHHIERVNLFSLDVEGGELDVLRSINFAKVRFDVVMVEQNNYEPRWKINDTVIILLRAGYEYLGSIAGSGFFARRPVPPSLVVSCCRACWMRQFSARVRVVGGNSIPMRQKTVSSTDQEG